MENVPVSGALWLMGPCGLGEVLDFVPRALGSQARDAVVKDLSSCGG